MTAKTLEKMIRRLAKDEKELAKKGGYFGLKPRGGRYQDSFHRSPDTDEVNYTYDQPTRTTTTSNTGALVPLKGGAYSTGGFLPILGRLAAQFGVPVLLGALEKLGKGYSTGGAYSTGGYSTGGAANLWLEHVKNVRAQNPNLSYKQALMEAKKSYKKMKGGVLLGGEVVSFSGLKGGRKKAKGGVLLGGEVVSFSGLKGGRKAKGGVLLGGEVTGFSGLKGGAGTKAGAQKNPWMQHVAKFRQEHPDLKYADVLRQAKLTYKK